MSKFLSCIASVVFLSASLPSLEAAEVGRKQSGIKGLLVIDLGNGDYAGAASQMNATVIKKSSVEGFEVSFNQEVGKMMTTATKEVVKFMNVRHDDAPTGVVIELAFADKYAPKDGPSAAVATALLVNSIITGEELNQDFAVTGDMNATGSVQPVGGVMSKVRGAAKKCKLVAIPEKNVRSIHDAYIIEGIPYLTAIQIFSIKDFEQAHVIAGKRTEEVKTAIVNFEAVQKALKRNPKYVYNPKVKAKLRSILKTLPNHLSADLLLKHGNKKAPKSLSLSGSIIAVDNASMEFSKMLKSGQFQNKGGNDDVLRGLIHDLRRLKVKLDKRTRGYCDSYIDLAEYVKKVRSKKTWNRQNQRDLNAAISKMRGKREALLKNTEVREELMED